MGTAYRHRFYLSVAVVWALFGAPASAQERLRAHDVEGGLQSATFAPTGGTYTISATGSDFTTLYDTKTGKALKGFARALGHTSAVAFDPAERVFASAVMDRNKIDGETFLSVRGWNLASGEQLFDFRGHTAKIVSVAVSSDAKRIATAQLDGTVRLWAVGEKEPLAVIDEHAGAVALAFTPSGGAFVTAGEDGKLVVWDAKTGKRVARLAERAGALAAVSISADGKELLVATGTGEVHVWNFAARERAKRIPPPDLGPQVDIVTVSAGPRLAAAATGRVVHVWDLTTGKAIARFEHPKRYEVRSVRIAPDGKTVLSGATDSVTTKSEVALWVLPPRT
jgi:WD40 repeat protein